MYNIFVCMLDLRQRLFLIISIGVLLVLAIVLSILAIKKHNTVTTNPENTTPQGTTNASDSIGPDVFDTTLNLQPVIGDPTQLSSVLANEDETHRFVRQRSIDFIERFLSYSNQSKNSHIRDVLPLVTSDMAGWIQTQGQQYSDTYHGSTTQVIVSRVDALEGDTARVHIEAQQYLESTDGDERIYHTGRVELLKQQGEWLIDGLYWD